MLTDLNVFSSFREKFYVNELKVISSKFWTWSIRPYQPTLGSGIISLNRYAANLSEVTPDEMSDLTSIIRVLEPAIKNSFDYNIMNYLMLMMIDHHVHYHVIPRYSAIKEFAGLDWVDKGWPAMPLVGESQHDQIRKEVLLSIRDVLRSSVKSPA